MLVPFSTLPQCIKQAYPDPVADIPCKCKAIKSSYTVGTYVVGKQTWVRQPQFKSAPKPLQRSAAPHEINQAHGEVFHWAYVTPNQIIITDEPNGFAHTWTKKRRTGWIQTSVTPIWVLRT